MPIWLYIVGSNRNSSPKLPHVHRKQRSELEQPPIGLSEFIEWIESGRCAHAVGPPNKANFLQTGSGGSTYRARKLTSPYREPYKPPHRRTLGKKDGEIATFRRGSVVREAAAEGRPNVNFMGPALYGVHIKGRIYRDSRIRRRSSCFMVCCHV